LTQNPDLTTALDDDMLDLVVGGGQTHTGGRFMLDVAGHNVGYFPASSLPPPPPPPPPPTRP